MKNQKSSLVNKDNLGARTWFNLCMFGFVGQLAWNLENMYFNTFLYNTVYEGGTVTQGMPSMSAIKFMVAFSAITAVVTTFIMGNLSDKINKRKIFISAGYIVWGITVAVFGFVTKDNISSLFGIDKADIGAVVTATSITVIVLDCVMTFIGSTGNDSAFNAWVTDIGSSNNRATVESVLSLLPIAATLIIVVLGGFVQSIGYRSFFNILGGIVVLCGLIGLFTLKDAKKSETLKAESRQNGNYFKELFYGFRPSVVKTYSKLYLALASCCIYSVAVQIFFPYLLIYLEHSLGFDIENLISYISPKVIIGVLIVLLAAVAIIIGGGKLIDRVGKKTLIFVCAAFFVAGLFVAYFAHTLLSFAICAVPILLGSGFVGIMLNATIRDNTPEDKVGLFQGIRMIFTVLIPMIAGPFIGDFVCSISAAGQYVDELGNTTYEPCSAMFLAASVVSLISLVPLIALRKKGFSNNTDK